MIRAPRTGLPAREAFLRMRNAVIALTLLLAVLPSITAAQALPEDFPDEFLRQFDASMAKFEALAQEMPQSSYEWSPGEEVMTVARVYGHVARYNYLYPAQNLGVEVPPAIPMEEMESLTSKEALVDLLRTSGEHVRAVVAEGSAEEWGEPTRLYGRDVPRWSVLLQLLAHMNEHLGQSIAYARMNGVAPPWSR